MSNELPDGLRQEVDAYYSEAATWGHDRVRALEGSRRTAWIVAGIATALVALLALAIFAMLPLKTVVPYTLLVDRQTGFVQTLKPLDAQQVAPDAALTQSFLVQYIIAREEFDIDTVQADYRKVALWSVDSARSDYLSAIQIGNPDSPLVRLPRSAILETRIRSVSALGDRVALVRFETARRDRGGIAQVPQAWVAIVHYRFSNTPMSVEDRYLNPLGFQVLRYRRNAETPPVPAAEPETRPPAGPTSFGVPSYRTDPRLTQPVPQSTLLPPAVVRPTR